jgi:hypothetical protein
VTKEEISELVLEATRHSVHGKLHPGGRLPNKQRLDQQQSSISINEQHHPSTNDHDPLLDSVAIFVGCVWYKSIGNL